MLNVKRISFVIQLGRQIEGLEESIYTHGHVLHINIVVKLKHIVLDTIPHPFLIGSVYMYKYMIVTIFCDCVFMVVHVIHWLHRTGSKHQWK